MNGKLRHLGVSGLLVGSLLLGGPAPARAGTLTKTVDCGAGQTIAGALQSLLAALPGTLRVIITGICNENVTVARDDVILVAGVGGATVNGPDLTINTITVNADRVTIDGLEVTGGRNGITAQGAGKLTIRNCDVHDTGRSGIAIGYGTSATIDNCLVQNNPLDGINALGGTIIVTNSTISANARNGIFILFGGVGQIGVNPRFDAAGPNTISNNGGNGIPSYVAACFGDGCFGTGTIKSARVLTHNVRSLFWTGPLRSPGRLQNTFAQESFMDELAASVKADPV